MFIYIVSKMIIHLILSCYLWSFIWIINSEQDYS